MLLIALLAGCNQPDQQLVNFAEQNAQLQARQNEAMAQLNREMAAGTRQLLAAQGAATDQLLIMQRELQQQRSLVEAERRDLAQERRRESVLGPLISVLGLTCLSLLPLLVCGGLLAHLQHEPQVPLICDLLLDELLHQEPAPRVPGMLEPASPALTAPHESGETPASTRQD